MPWRLTPSGSRQRRGPGGRERGQGWGLAEATRGFKYGSRARSRGTAFATAAFPGSWSPSWLPRGSRAGHHCCSVSYWQKKRRAPSLCRRCRRRSRVDARALISSPAERHAGPVDISPTAPPAPALAGCSGSSPVRSGDAPAPAPSPHSRLPLPRSAHPPRPQSWDDLGAGGSLSARSAPGVDNFPRLGPAAPWTGASGDPVGPQPPAPAARREALRWRLRWQ